MKATRHNGRSGKHGTYDAKHNDRRFDVENSEHIDAERTKMEQKKVKRFATIFAEQGRRMISASDIRLRKNF